MGWNRWNIVFFFFKQKTAYEIKECDGVQTCALPISQLTFRCCILSHLHPNLPVTSLIAMGIVRHRTRSRTPNLDPELTLLHAAPLTSNPNLLDAFMQFLQIPHRHEQHSANLVPRLPPFPLSGLCPRIFPFSRALRSGHPLLSPQTQPHFHPRR